MFEIWLDIAQHNLVRLASEDVAAPRSRLDLLDELAIPLPQAQLHLLALEFKIVRIEVDGLVGGRLARSVAHSLDKCRFTGVFYGEFDLGLTRHENPPEAVIVWFGPHDWDKSLLSNPGPRQIAKSPLSLELARL